LAEKNRRRKLRQRQSQLKNNSKLVARARVDNITAQLLEQQKPTFDRSAFQCPDNIPHGSSTTVVLSKKKPKAEFDKAAWGPPVSPVKTTIAKNIRKAAEIIEQSRIQPVAADFNKEAWAPPDVDS